MTEILLNHKPEIPELNDWGFEGDDSLVSYLEAHGDLLLAPGELVRELFYDCQIEEVARKPGDSHGVVTLTFLCTVNGKLYRFDSDSFGGGIRNETREEKYTFYPCKLVPVTAFAIQDIQP